MSARDKPSRNPPNRPKIVKNRVIANPFIIISEKMSHIMKIVLTVISGKNIKDKINPIMKLKMRVVGKRMS